MDSDDRMAIDEEEVMDVDEEDETEFDSSNHVRPNFPALSAAEASVSLK